MVPCWVLSILQHLVFRGPKRGHNFDNHPNRLTAAQLSVNQAPASSAAAALSTLSALVSSQATCRLLGLRLIGLTYGPPFLGPYLFLPRVGAASCMGPTAEMV